MTRYTKEHEWVRIEENEARIGITNYAQDSLGDITFVELPKVGESVRQGGTLCVVESVKAASEIFAPISGTVSTVNDLLSESPETINASPEQDGWICTLKDIALVELDSLMDTESYAEFVKGLE